MKYRITRTCKYTETFEVEADSEADAWDKSQGEAGMTQNGTEKERAGRYTKKPITIEAVQYGRRFDWPDWFHDAVSANTVVTHGTAKFADETDLCFCEIKTLEGVMRCNEGDWIIRGVKGEMYPCKDEIFRLTYEPVVARES